MGKKGKTTYLAFQIEVLDAGYLVTLVRNYKSHLRNDVEYTKKACIDRMDVIDALADWGAEILENRE